MEKVKKRLLRTPYAVRFAAKQLVCLAVGLILARTRLFDGLPSFAVAFAAAAPSVCTFTACIGSAAGSLLFAPDLLTGLTGAAAVLACGMICFALRTITGVRLTPPTACVVAFLCCAAAGGTTLLAGGFYLSGVLLYLCDGILAGGAAFFFLRARTLRRLVRRPCALNSAEALSLIAASAVLLLSFASWKIFIFVPARAAAALLVLTSGYLFAQSGGGAAGILCGAAMEIACGLPGLACCYGLGGLLGGLFSRCGRMALPVCMTATAGLFPLLVQTNEAVAVFAETALASAVFCAVPQSALRSLKQTLGMTALSESGDPSAVRQRLHAAARAVSSITPYMTEQQLRHGKLPGVSRMTRRVRELSCEDCAKRDTCWQTRETETAEALAESFQLLHRKQYLSPDNLPAPLGSDCTRRNMLSASCVQAYEETAQTPYAARGIPEWLDADPFSTAATLLSDAAEQYGERRQRLPRESDAAGQTFRALGVPVHTADCYLHNGRLVLTATSGPYPDSVNKTALTERLGKACGCLFALPTVRAASDTFHWQFRQTARLRLRTGTAQFAADGRVCGDFFLTFPHDGRQILLLCDGMGTGAEAAADAEAAAEIFASLVEADLSFACALRTVNEAMLLREDTESVSALDAVSLDLYTGDTVFYKAGAAASYFLHKGKVDRIETPCMPVGILPDTTFRETKRTLRAGDVIVLVSDGTCGMRDDHIVRALTAFRGGSAQKLAEDILAHSHAAGKKRADDSTVLVVVAESA